MTDKSGADRVEAAKAEGAREFMAAIGRFRARSDGRLEPEILISFVLGATLAAFTLLWQGRKPEVARGRFVKAWVESLRAILAEASQHA